LKRILYPKDLEYSRLGGEGEGEKVSALWGYLLELGNCEFLERLIKRSPKPDKCIHLSCFLWDKRETWYRPEML
jgi:hypothetical protein